MKGFNYTILFITIALLLGILLSPYINLSALEIGVICLISFVVLFSTHLYTFYKRINSWSFAVLTVVTFISLGILTSKLQDPLNTVSHYENIHFSAQSGAIITIKEVLKPGKYAKRFYAELNELAGKKTYGKVLVYLYKDSLDRSEELKVDGTYFLAADIAKVPAPKNPYQFNYKNYLNKQGVYKQISVNTNQLYVLNTQVKTLKGYAAVFRENLQKSIENRLINAKNRAVIEALLLGQRQELSTDLTEDYAAAGMIHILAVSGLHVGIIMLLLQFLLNPLGNTPIIKLSRTVFIITVIWMFAFITGFSPSVLRAATMFSFIQIGIYFNRKNAGLNALVFSAFVLLLFDSSLIYEVGFQLSYLAVFFIIWVQPLFIKLWNPQFFLTKLFWGIFSVSIAAQIGVLPLSIYYFHQFPGLFLVSNLVILPVLGLILSCGVLVLFLGLFHILPDFVLQIFNFMITCLNDFISWIASFENLVFQHITFSALMLSVSYLLIIPFIFLLKKYSYKRLITTLTAFLILIIALIFEKSQTRSELYVLHKNRQSLFIEESGQKLAVYHRDSIPLENFDNQINPFLENTQAKTIEEESLQNYFRFKRNEILLIDSTGVYNVPHFKPDFVVLTESPQINLDRLVKLYPNVKVIADGSNYRSYVTRWKATCIKKDIPFHSTYEKGYYEF